MKTIRRLVHGDAIPEGTPGRYNARGYVILRWRVGLGAYVEAPEHRVVAGLPITTCHVHHRNGKRDDNRPENLEVITARTHSLLHGLAKRRWDRDRAATLYECGWTTTQLSEMFGVNDAVIYRGLLGRVEFRKGAPPKHVVDETGIVARFKDGQKYFQIAREIKATPCVVRRVLVEHGLIARYQPSPKVA